MAIIALLIATIAIKLLEQEIVEHYHSKAAEAVSSIETILAINLDATPESLRTQIEAEIDRLQIPAVTVESGFLTVTIGVIREHHSVYSAALPAHSDEVPGDTRTAVVTVFELPVAEILKTEKKKLMVALGGIFFVFGLLLQ